jgi:RNA polymerase sigma-70 factor (ECF subfamily)
LLDYFRRRVSQDSAHDLVAEVFLIAWRRRAIAPEEPDLRPWLFKVARNVLRNHRRAAARRMRLHERLLANATTDVKQPPEQSDTGAILRWALTQLREPDREILRLTAWEGCTPNELATVLGCSVNAGAVRLHRARRRLRKVLAELPADTTASATPTVTHRPGRQ